MEICDSKIDLDLETDPEIVSQSITLYPGSILRKKLKGTKEFIKILGLKRKTLEIFVQKSESITNPCWGEIETLSWLQPSKNLENFHFIGLDVSSSGEDTSMIMQPKLRMSTIKHTFACNELVIKFFTLLDQNFGNLKDFSLQIGDSVIKTHKSVLLYYCTYFQSLFLVQNQQLKENVTNTLQLSSDDHNIKTLKHLISWMYLGKFLTPVVGEDVLDLYRLAHHFGANTLTEYLSNVMWREIDLENCLALYDFAIIYDSQWLIQCCHDFVIKHPGILTQKKLVVNSTQNLIKSVLENVRISLEYKEKCLTNWIENGETQLTDLYFNVSPYAKLVLVYFFHDTVFKEQSIKEPAIKFVINLKKGESTQVGNSNGGNFHIFNTTNSDSVGLDYVTFTLQKGWTHNNWYNKTNGIQTSFSNRKSWAKTDSPETIFLRSFFHKNFNSYGFSDEHAQEFYDVIMRVKSPKTPIVEMCINRNTIAVFKFEAPSISATYHFSRKSNTVGDFHWRWGVGSLNRFDYSMSLDEVPKGYVLPNALRLIHRLFRDKNFSQIATEYYKDEIKHLVKKQSELLGLNDKGVETFNTSGQGLSLVWPSTALTSPFTLGAYNNMTLTASSNTLVGNSTIVGNSAAALNTLAGNIVVGNSAALNTSLNNGSYWSDWVNWANGMNNS